MRESALKDGGLLRIQGVVAAEGSETGPLQTHAD